MFSNTFSITNHLGALVWNKRQWHHNLVWSFMWVWTQNGLLSVTFKYLVMYLLIFVYYLFFTCLFTILWPGWGRISPNTSDLATKLKQAKAAVASHSQCVKTNGPFVHEPSMVCVGGQGSSVCNGDSGGPYRVWRVGDGWFVVRPHGWPA